jgi:hypothetical protein
MMRRALAMAELKDDGLWVRVAGDGCSALAYGVREAAAVGLRTVSCCAGLDLWHLVDALLFTSQTLLGRVA